MEKNKKHNVKFDYAGNGYPRFTCYTCGGATAVRQPFMNESRWATEKASFFLKHPTTKKIKKI